MADVEDIEHSVVKIIKAVASDADYATKWATRVASLESADPQQRLGLVTQWINSVGAVAGKQVVEAVKQGCSLDMPLGRTFLTPEPGFPVDMRLDREVDNACNEEADRLAGQDQGFQVRLAAMQMLLDKAYELGRTSYGDGRSYGRQK